MANFILTHEYIMGILLELNEKINEKKTFIYFGLVLDYTDKKS